MATQAEPGYDPRIVFDWLNAHCSRRDDGRYVAIGRRLLEDSHRDTFDRWRLAWERDDGFIVPLGRLDEILCHYGLMLWELDHWATEQHGWDGYLS